METSEKIAENQEIQTQEQPLAEEKPTAKKDVVKEKSEPRMVYFENAKVVCACGNTFTTGSTKEEIHVEICSNCHPFFTGQEKFVDTEGRVERFNRMADAKKEGKVKKETEVRREQPKTLKEMLQSLQK